MSARHREEHQLLAKKPDEPVLLTWSFPSFSRSWNVKGSVNAKQNHEPLRLKIGIEDEEHELCGRPLDRRGNNAVSLSPTRRADAFMGRQPADVTFL
jgi:hypothetical protein